MIAGGISTGPVGDIPVCEIGEAKIGLTDASMGEACRLVHNIVQDNVVDVEELEQMEEDEYYFGGGKCDDYRVNPKTLKWLKAIEKGTEPFSKSKITFTPEASQKLKEIEENDCNQWRIFVLHGLEAFFGSD